MPERLPPAAHGALDYAELERLGISPEDVLDFSVNSNPYGASPLVREAIRQTPIERYPDREALALRRALSRRLAAPVEQILPGNGAAELIQLTAFAFLKPGDEVLIVGPTFGEYERASRLMGAQIHHWRAKPENGFAIRADEIQAMLERHTFRLVFLCNPNNPTGQVFLLEALESWARSFPDTFFVVDEAYLAFAPAAVSAIGPGWKNILVLRSMTKDYALAGLRLGYVVADCAVIDLLRNVRPAWNVNALAQAAGLAALQDEVYLEETLHAIQNDKVGLVKGLEAVGIQPLPSQTHFFLLPVENGRDFRRRLLQHGIQVRDCDSFGLPGYVRIATRQPDENARLLAALKEEFA